MAWGKFFPQQKNVKSERLCPEGSCGISLLFSVSNDIFVIVIFVICLSNALIDLKLRVILNVFFYSCVNEFPLSLHFVHVIRTGLQKVDTT